MKMFEFDKNKLDKMAYKPFDIIQRSIGTNSKIVLNLIKTNISEIIFLKNPTSSQNFLKQ